MITLDMYVVLYSALWLFNTKHIIINRFAKLIERLHLVQDYKSEELISGLVHKGNPRLIGTHQPP